MVLLSEATKLSPEEPNARLNLARLYIDAGRFDAAARDFEWLRDHGRRDLSPFPGVARYALAQTFEAAGRTTEARTAYADLLAFWRTADSDLPFVVGATKALARLGS